jgi:hypothetical protein
MINRIIGRSGYVKARTPALDYVGLRTVIEWIMVAHVDSSDCRCRCIVKIIARDLRLVASRLYHTGVTRPWTHHVPCSYIIPLFRCRPPGLHNSVQEWERKEMESKQSNNRSTYAIVRTHKSHNRSVPLRVTFRWIWRTGKLHLPLTGSGGGKTRADAIYTGPRSKEEKKRRREERNKKTSKSDPVSISQLPNPYSTDHPYS